MMKLQQLVSAIAATLILVIPIAILHQTGFLPSPTNQRQRPTPGPGQQVLLEYDGATQSIQYFLAPQPEFPYNGTWVYGRHGRVWIDFATHRPGTPPANALSPLTYGR